MLNRRELKTRDTKWAPSFAKLLLKLGLTPNAVSVISIVMALLGGLCLCGTLPQASWLPPSFLYLLAAIFIQLRLICNLMDGLMAIEGGKKTPTGELFNEVPDRIADLLLLAPVGYLMLEQPLGYTLSWLAVCGSFLTPYIRCLGASITSKHDFAGPMAKQQRMAFLTILCLYLSALPFLPKTFPAQEQAILWFLFVLNLGILVTSIRRIGRLAKSLKT